MHGFTFVSYEMIRVDLNQFDKHFCFFHYVRLCLKKTEVIFLPMYTSLSTLCVCGDSFNLQHALSCSKGGLVMNRHNKRRNLTAEILGEVSKQVVIELLLTPSTGEKFPNFQIRATKQEQLCQLEGYGITGRRPFEKGFQSISQMLFTP